MIAFSPSSPTLLVSLRERGCARPLQRAGSLFGGRHLQHNGGDGEELPRGGELHSVVHLFPVREQPGLALVRRLERRAFDRVQEKVHALQKNKWGEGVSLQHHAGQI